MICCSYLQFGGIAGMYFEIVLDFTGNRIASPTNREETWNLSSKWLTSWCLESDVTVEDDIQHFHCLKYNIKALKYRVKKQSITIVWLKQKVKSLHGKLNKQKICLFSFKVKSNFPVSKRKKVISALLLVRLRFFEYMKFYYKGSVLCKNFF